MKKIRLGVIGTGIIVNEAHVPALLRLGDRYEITALCNRTPAKAQAVADRLGIGTDRLWQDWRAFLAEAPVEAVLVCLPIELNFPASLAAARAGKHVLCEKPVGQSLEETHQAVELASRFGITYMVAEDCHFTPQFVKAAELARSGAVGRVRAIQWNVLNFLALSDKYAQTVWRTRHVYPGGYVLDGGVHFVHVLQMIAGRISRVRAETLSIEPGLGRVDTAFALLRHKNGVLSSLNMSWRTRLSGPEPLRIFGDEGSLAVSEKEIIRIDQAGKEERIEFDKEDGYYQQLVEFHRAVTTCSPPSMTTESAAHDVEVILAILEAAQKGTTVELRAEN
ncbi:MAG: Gfo/Idh/MocA family oxidoreductase [Candidatus Glassbacteria bacterium]